MDLTRAAAATSAPEAIDVDATARALGEFWSQEGLFEANGSLLKVAKGAGSTRWHVHGDQDEVFMVTHGELVVQSRAGDVVLGPGEIFSVPLGWSTARARTRRPAF